MGISCSDERDKYLGYGFTIPEPTKMKEIFTQISSEKPKFVLILFHMPYYAYLGPKAEKHSASLGSRNASQRMLSSL